jgi:hypothetical protein
LSLSTLAEVVLVKIFSLGKQNFVNSLGGVKQFKFILNYQTFYTNLFFDMLPFFVHEMLNFDDEAKLQHAFKRRSFFDNGCRR